MLIRKENYMFTRKFVDYTAMPIGKVTKQGVVEACERCGKPGAHAKVAIPQGEIEKWVHSQHFKLFTHYGANTSCIRTMIAVDSRTMDGWGWSD